MLGTEQWFWVVEIKKKIKRPPKCIYASKTMQIELLGIVFPPDYKYYVGNKILKP